MGCLIFVYQNLPDSFLSFFSHVFLLSWLFGCDLWEITTYLWEEGTGLSHHSMWNARRLPQACAVGRCMYQQWAASWLAYEKWGQPLYHHCHVPVLRPKCVKSLHIRQPHPQSSHTTVYLWTLVARHLPLYKEMESSSKKSNGPREGPNAKVKLLAGITEVRFPRSLVDE